MMADRRHHAGDGLAGHGRRRGGLAPADDAIVGLDAHQNVVGARDVSPAIFTGFFIGRLTAIGSMVLIRTLSLGRKVPRVGAGR